VVCAEIRVPPERDVCAEAERPISLSSDAHEPDHIGYGYDKAVTYLRELLLIGLLALGVLLIMDNIGEIRRRLS